MNLKENPIVILDGAVGTELERRGYRTKLPLWSASAIREAPELLRQIHKEYILSGADLITANTFRVSLYTYQKAGLKLEEVEMDLTRALSIVQKAYERSYDQNILGSITSLEDCYRPEQTPNNAILYDFHGRQVDAFKKVGYDTILIETMHTLREANIIAEQCVHHNLEFMISFITGKTGELLGGASLLDSIQTVAQYKPKAILLNCRPASELYPQIPFLKTFEGEIGVYPNGSGVPDDTYGWRFDSPHPENEFVQNASRWIDEGINIIGGCCGTRPADIKALSDYLEAK